MIDWSTGSRGCVVIAVAAGLLILPTLAAAQQGAVSAPATATTWHCYDITITNNEKERKIKDLHFTFPREAPNHMKAPGGWVSRSGAGGSLIFETPPPNPPATGTTERANPIDPGKSLDGFRFCLPKEQKRVNITMSYDRGADTAVEIFQGVEAESEKPVIHTSKLYCTRLHLTAPAETDVADVHLSKSGSDSSPKFDDVSPPTGWSGSTSEDSSILEAGTGAPIAAGTSTDIEICTRGKPSKIDWKFTDKDHNDIPEGKGSTKLKY